MKTETPTFHAYLSRRLLAITFGALALCGPVLAQSGPGERLERYLRMSPDERQQAQARWRNLPPEQRVQARQEIREHLGAMTPEQRQQMRQQMRQHWQQLPPDDRRYWREQRQTQREQWQPQQDERQMRRESPPGNRPYRGAGRGWRGWP